MDVFDISACAIAVAKVLEAHGTPVSEIDKVLAAAREVATTSTVVKVTEEKLNLAAAIRDTLSKVAKERSIRQQLVPQRTEKESQPNDLTNQFETFHR